MEAWRRRILKPVDARNVLGRFPGGMYLFSASASARPNNSFTFGTDKTVQFFFFRCHVLLWLLLRARGPPLKKICTISLNYKLECVLQPWMFHKLKYKVI